MENAYSCDRFRQAHSDLCDAGCTAATERVGHRLLGMADEVTGQVNMTWDELVEVTGCENINAARRHLTRLAAANLIHYSTNDYVYVTWLVWMRNGACTRQISAPTRQNCAADEAEVALFGEVEGAKRVDSAPDQRVDAPPAARQRAGSSHARLLVSQSVHSSVYREERLTNKLTEAQQRSVRLLMDDEVGVDKWAATTLAANYEFGEIAKQVMTWRRQVRAGLVNGSGALIHRISHGFGAMVTDEDRQCELWRRHCGSEERKRYSLEYYD